jgi:hypothetical protein
MIMARPPLVVRSVCLMERPLASLVVPSLLRGLLLETLHDGDRTAPLRLGRREHQGRRSMMLASDENA